MGTYLKLRATSHTRLRACDHYTPSTLISEKGGASPTLLHTTLEGPVCECKMDFSLHVFLHGIKRIMFHGHLEYFQKPFLGGMPNTKPGDHGTSNAHKLLICFILSCVRTHMNRNSLKWHWVEGRVTYDFTLHLRVRDHIA